MLKSHSVITFVTGNANKLEEVKRMLAKSAPAVNIVSQDVDLPEIQGLPDDVARRKCEAAAKLIRGPVLVEDTSLCFNALQGAPAWRPPARA
jgi:inosine triphosphate pyrophosphatase